MGISSPGVGSGLDVGALVTKLMSLEQKPLTTLQARATQVQNEISAFGKISSQLDALRTVASDLAKPASWGARAATLSDPKLATVTATNAAPAGQYSLEVTNLAAAHRLASSPYSASTDAVGPGTLTIDVGTWTGTSFAAKAGSTPIVVTVDGTNDTLGGVRDAINAQANGAVRASIVTDSSGSRLVISSTATGAGSALRISAADDDLDDTDSAGLSALAYAGDTSALAPGAKQVQAAQDALIKVDGLTIRSATNKVEGAIEGITLNLTGSNPGTTATLGVAVDTQSATDLVNKFVTAYNDSVKLFTGYLKIDPVGNADGLLQSDAGARSLGASLRTLATRQLPSGALASLSQAGIALQRDGTLSVNATKLAKALEGGTADLATLFTATGGGVAEARGIAVGFKAALDTALNAGGTLKTRTANLSDRLRANQLQQDTQESRLEMMQARLLKQYSALDGQLASMQSISSSLTQSLAALTANQQSK
ncbi:MAG: flagellar filament capping protein FliD [Betaproteobacteria bacterium]|nr:flagellar filament capping protein FliD [Betaproteobacteria bacterium]